jgi:hypothetical protein
MTQLQDSPRLEDCALTLGAWIGSVLPGIDMALAQAGVDTWSAETREAVLRLVGHEMVQMYTEGEHELSEHPSGLNTEAQVHLARYAIARSRALRFG